ncbi:MAG: T9SS type A sorting domain-containing protein [Saprospiraceae bacterium]
MKNFYFIPLLFLAVMATANIPVSKNSLSPSPPPPAPDFTVTTSDGQLKKLYQDYISQQKLVVIEAFFTSCPPCATHAPLFQNLYTSMQSAYPGKIEFFLFSTLSSDSNVKVAQYKTSKGLTMPGVGNDGGSITALQPYLSGQFGQFQGTPTFIVIAPGSGAVYFDIRGISPSQTIALLQQKIEELFPKECSVANPFGGPLSDVNISVDAASFDTSIAASNTYRLSNIASLQNIPYTLKPYKMDSPVGLTTYDLVLISKHILAIEPFKCPWQMLAADVNCTGSITTFDIVTARKVILGILDSLPCGAWRFMPDSASISNGDCQDFVGVKLGDVNAGPCNDSLAGPSDTREPSQSIYFQERDFQAGETASIPLFFMENTAIEGLQFAFNFNPNLLKINKIETATLEGFDAGSYLAGEGSLVVSWIHPHGQQVMASSPLIRIELTAPKGGRLSDLLRLAQSHLIPEYYTMAGQIRPLSLRSLPKISNYSISPNPVTDRFALQSYSERAEESLVQLLDLQGKIIFEKTFSAVIGMNRWEIEPNIKTKGLYLLKVNGDSAVKVVFR